MQRTSAKPLVFGVCAFLAFGLGSTSFAQTVAALPGLVGSRAAEGNAFDAVGDNHGILKGNVMFAPGKVGQGFVFDGSGGYGELPDNSSVQLLQEVTLVAWSNLGELPTTTGRFQYIAGRSQVANDFDLEVETDYRVRFYPCGGAGGRRLSRLAITNEVSGF